MGHDAHRFYHRATYLTYLPLPGGTISGLSFCADHVFPARLSSFFGGDTQR